MRLIPPFGHGSRSNNIRPVDNHLLVYRYRSQAEYIQVCGSRFDSNSQPLVLVASTFTLNSRCRNKQLIFQTNRKVFKGEKTKQ